MDQNILDYREDHDAFELTSRILRNSLSELLVPWDPDGPIGNACGARGIPVMVMLRHDGTVAHVHTGDGAEMLSSLIAEIQALLHESAADALAAPL